MTFQARRLPSQLGRNLGEDARPAGLQVEPSRHREHRVPKRLAVEPASRELPEELVVGVDLRPASSPFADCRYAAEVTIRR